VNNPSPNLLVTLNSVRHADQPSWRGTGCDMPDFAFTLKIKYEAASNDRA
jgi:hypothetical protein